MLGGEVFVGDYKFRENQDVLHGIDVLTEIFTHLDDFANHDGGTRERFADGPLAALVAFGEFDFAFGVLAPAIAPTLYTSYRDIVMRG